MKIDRLVVDIHQSPEFITAMRRKFANVEVESLGPRRGDVHVTLPNRLIVIETKETDDFINSVQSGRIFAQAKGIRELTPFAFILYKDFHYDSRDRVMGIRNGHYGPLEWTSANVIGALTNLQAHNVITRPCTNGWGEGVYGVLEWASKENLSGFARTPKDLGAIEEEDLPAARLLSFFERTGSVQIKNFLDWAGKRPLYKYLELATTPFKGKDRPRGWTNSTIEKNRALLGLPNNSTLSLQYREKEWIEELDE